MNTLQTSSAAQRRARAHFLIQLGGLIVKAGLLEVFDIPLGRDLQKDPALEENVKGLFHALVMLKKHIGHKKIIDPQEERHEPP